MNLLLKTPTKTKFLRIKWREINDRTCEKPHEFSLLLSYPNTVTSHMIEGKFLTSCTYMSIMISFRKTPSAKSVIDSMRALPLKVLFAYRDDKKSLDKTEFTIARCKVIITESDLHTSSSHYLQTLNTQRNGEIRRKQNPSHPNNQWALKKSLCSGHGFTRSQNRKYYPKKFTVTVNLKPPVDRIHHIQIFTQPERSEYRMAGRKIYLRKKSVET